MEKTWRWFGKKDEITLTMLRQIGVEGIVTALHDVPNGEVWPLETVKEMKEYIESAGLRWSVVESLPVCEAIKYAGPDRDRLITNYIQSLTNLGKAGIKTVCYNFMPVIDWIRTDLNHPWPDGTTSLYFNKTRFAYFDLKILKRKHAEKDYSEKELMEVEKLGSRITGEEELELIDTVIVKTQGFVNGNIREGETEPVSVFRRLLSLYEGVDKGMLRENMRYFLAAVMPVCEKYGIDMCVHPDDPPFQMLGLPRIVTCEEDIAWILDAVDNPHNGLTFCAGSLSAGVHNDTRGLARRFAGRTRFVHLRSTETLSGGDFIESSHLSGRGHLIELIRVFESSNPGLPMRVDHGRMMLGDEKLGYNPGYSFHGRMLALLRNSNIGQSGTLPVLAVTARVDSDAARFREAGFAGCLHKPFSGDELMAATRGVERPDFTSVMEGEEHADELLDIFIEDTEAGLAGIRDAVSSGDYKKLGNIIHKAVPVWETIRIDIPLQELAYMGSLPPEKWAGMSDERIGRLVRAVENAVRKAVTLKEKMNGDNTHSGG